MFLIGLAVLVVVVVAVMAVVVSSRWWAWRRIVARRVLVQMVDGETAIVGVLLERRADLLVIANAQITLDGKQQPRPADGVLVVERGAVLFVQVTGGWS